MTSLSPSPLARVLGPSHIALEVSDLDHSIAFYTRVLGLEVFHDEREGGGAPSIKGVVAGFAIELAQPDPPPASLGSPKARPPAGAPCVAFTVEDAVAAHDALKAAGVTVAAEVSELMGVKFFYVYDPDGYPFELIQYPLSALALADLRVHFS